MKSLKEFAEARRSKIQKHAEPKVFNLFGRQSQEAAKRGIYGNIDMVEYCKEMRRLHGDPEMNIPAQGTFNNRRPAPVTKLAWRWNGSRWVDA